MGMTIEESKQLLSDYQRLFNSLNGDYKLSQVQIAELSHSIGTAIDIMHKYQKIQEIVENRNIKPPLTTLNRIIKVVEDGNDD